MNTIQDNQTKDGHRHRLQPIKCMAGKKKSIRRSYFFSYFLSPVWSHIHLFSVIYFIRRVLQAGRKLIFTFFQFWSHTFLSEILKVFQYLFQGKDGRQRHIFCWSINILSAPDIQPIQVLKWENFLPAEKMYKMSIYFCYRKSLLK